jgi:hypothetical protein
MRRLVIDDLRVFAFDAVYARSSVAGVGALYDEPWDEVWLDHDLGGDDTIMPVVDTLVFAARFREPFDIGTIVIHTSNPPGRKNIRLALERFYKLRDVYLDAQTFLEDL